MNDAWLNLREATNSENNANKRLQTNNTSGFKWAYRTRSGRWRASINFNGKVHYIRTYDTPAEAHINAWSTARELRGDEFVRIK
jgi:hypothetical protein